MQASDIVIQYRGLKYYRFQSCFESDRWIFCWAISTEPQPRASLLVLYFVVLFCVKVDALLSLASKLTSLAFCMYVPFYVLRVWLLLILTDCCYFYNYKFTKI